MKVTEIFMKELQEFFNGRQNRIKTASQMCNNAILMQRTRLKNMGYFVKHDIALREGAPSHEFNHFGDDKYDVTNHQEHIFLKKEYYKNGRLVYKYQEDNTLFMYVEDLKAEKVDGKELVNCPNCGAPATLEAIRNGCSYCGTHFEMTELYPAVTNYFTKFDVSMVEDREKMNNPVGLLQTYGKAYSKLAKLLTSAPSAISMVAQGNLTSKKRFEEIMKQYIPDFSYLHFGDTAINMLKLLLFSDQPSSLPFMAKENCPVLAPGLIDYEFVGFGLDQKDVVLNGKYVVANVYIYVKSLYDQSGRVVNVQENYRATLCRDISKPVKMGFSYTKMNCPTCGGVFDAYKTTKCPFCSNIYKFQEDEWFVLDISKGC